MITDWRTQVYGLGYSYISYTIYGCPFHYVRDGDAENLIYLVLAGFITSRTLRASLLISTHIEQTAYLLYLLTLLTYLLYLLTYFTYLLT